MDATAAGALLRIGYRPAEVARAIALAGGRLAAPADVARVVDAIDYRRGWREGYEVRSVRRSLEADEITCIDAAVLAYGLLEAMPAAAARLLAIHRRDPAAGEECGHVVAVYRGPDGRLGAISKSSFDGLGHRAPTFADEAALAASFAAAYVRMRFTPLWFGTSRLEDIASDVDWRFSARPVDVLSDRLQATYAFAFEVDDEAEAEAAAPESVL
jgi:hypothetical protein